VSWEHPLSPPRRRLLTVSANDALGAYRVLRAVDPEGPVPAPGQFAMLAAAEHWGGGLDERPFLPRAFSYARHEDGEAHFLLEDIGPGTERLCELERGQGLHVLGPLGRGFREPEESATGSDPARPRRAILVGGGVGIAPLAILQDRLGAGASVLLGFRDATRVRSPWAPRASATPPRAPGSPPGCCEARKTPANTPADRPAASIHLNLSLRSR
jgi:hypothetical protein